MKLNDTQLGIYVKKIALPGSDRDAFRAQAGRLVDALGKKIAEDGTYRIKAFRRAGSLEKGTSNRPRAGKAVDADIGVYFDVSDPNDFEVANLQALIKRLLARIIHEGRSEA